MDVPLQSAPKLLRRLGTLDASLIVIGGIIGAGIYMNPSVVARHVPSGPLILAVWVAGGVIALAGAGIFAELAARRPRDGGLYAYLRDAFHPAVAFMYGWTLLLVAQTGSIALGAITFAVYVEPLSGFHGASVPIAVAAIAVLTLVNSVGVRSGASAQNLLMIVTIAATVIFAIAGFVVSHSSAISTPVGHEVPLGTMIAAVGLALVPVLFAYDGWQSASFISAELKEPVRALSRGMIVGVLAVVVLYVAVNAAFLRVLGVSGLAATTTPAASVAQLLFGPVGIRIAGIVVALSTLGFLSNLTLVSPRVYFQMAHDGTFFKQLAWIHPRTHVPLVAILLQGFIATIITISGTYDQILNYVTSIDYVFIGLAAIALIVFRKRDALEAGAARPFFRMPGHPWTSLLFLASAWGIVGDVLIKSPVDTSIGFAILLSGLPVYWLFSKWNTDFAKRKIAVESGSVLGRDESAVAELRVVKPRVGTITRQ
jgi:basic amino acid/polyamine antiporter, APA family